MKRIEQNIEEIIPKNNYFCGRCKHDVILSNKDNVICNNCGFRIIYKKRSPKYIEYSAR